MFMKHLKKFEDRLSESIFSEYTSKYLASDIKETLTELLYGITDCDINVEISIGTTKTAYENNIGIHIGCKSLVYDIKFNFDEIHIMTILEVIDYLESKGRRLSYLFYRYKLKGMATIIYPNDIEKELRSLPNELYFIKLEFI